MNTEENQPAEEPVETLATLEAKLIEAEAMLHLALTEVYAARLRETSLINEVNRLQKGITDYVQAMRAKASVDTDWGRTKKQKGEAA